MGVRQFKPCAGGFALDQLAGRLEQSGLDNARAQLLLSRKRAELEDFINRGRDVSTAQMVRPQRG